MGVIKGLELLFDAGPLLAVSDYRRLHVMKARFGAHNGHSFGGDIGGMINRFRSEVAMRDFASV